MNPRRRLALAALAPWPWRARAQGGEALNFPRDHGAHRDTRTEWWYATGWLGTEAAPTQGVQVTFFRSRTGLGAGVESRFAARQLLFAHAAITDLANGRHLHDQCIERWSGAPEAALAAAALDRGRVHIGAWSLIDQGPGWRATIPARGFALELFLARTQPVLLQGEAGVSRKGPDAGQTSRYYSEPQLEAQGRADIGGRRTSGRGRFWMDHEWSEQYLHPLAVGWDWIGMNLFDGSALMAFVMRRRDGSSLWAGGGWRAGGRATQAFAAEAVRFRPGRLWRSPGSGASYPVEWQLELPAGRYSVRALLDAQELDSRASTGTIYWEGLSELLDAQGQRVGLGYLEMTGYAAPIRLARATLTGPGRA